MRINGKLDKLLTKYNAAIAVYSERCGGFCAYIGPTDGRLEDLERYANKGNDGSSGAYGLIDKPWFPGVRGDTVEHTITRLKLKILNIDNLDMAISATTIAWNHLSERNIAVILDDDVETAFGQLTSMEDATGLFYNEKGEIPVNQVKLNGKRICSLDPILKSKYDSERLYIRQKPTSERQFDAILVGWDSCDSGVEQGKHWDDESSQCTVLMEASSYRDGMTHIMWYDREGGEAYHYIPNVPFLKECMEKLQIEVEKRQGVGCWD